MTIETHGYTFHLLPEKALFLPHERLLVIADVHLGKARHFRKEGIAIPADTQADDYLRLAALFEKVNPAKVYFLGDLFHSTYNHDWINFSALIQQFPSISFTLIKGNHDIIDQRLFDDISVSVLDTLETTNLLFVHDVPDERPGDKLVIAGHIHPGISLSGSGRQSVTLPCYYKDGNVLLLPAFGKLTGLYKMPHTQRSQVYIILPDEVCPLPSPVR
ncbi:MAG: ligase-associated DNA damage response endonuclease PdeM [Taibaiella sp.]|nr:ligase-associated DNA damage response endonuclease PdeM [Taibaiella sp.]